MKYLVPLLSLAVLISGGIVTLDLVQRSQTTTINAGQFLSGVSGLKFAGGDGVVTFVYNGGANPKTEMFVVDESKWVPISAESLGNNRYQIMFDGNVPELELWIRVNGEEAEVPFRSVEPD